jgi:hypothetical protein
MNGGAYGVSKLRTKWSGSRTVTKDILNDIEKRRARKTLQRKAG